MKSESESESDSQTDVGAMGGGDGAKKGCMIRLASDDEYSNSSRSALAAVSA